jgi:ADP-L-glycero-D-manno-heptose 6-epimerase
MTHPTAQLPTLPRDPGRVLVTGGAGLIGSALVWGLNQHGVDDIVVVDRLGSDDRWRNLNALRFADYLEADDLFDALEHGALGHFDTVLHLGANSSTLETDVTGLIHNNFEYTKHLAHWALAEEATFVYASSAATYGDGAQGMDDRDELNALRALRPLNAYGYSKHLFDLYAARAGMLEHIVGLKYFNVFGPNEGHKGAMRSLVHKAYQQILDTGRVQLFQSHRPDYQDGEQRRDFLYVKDAVAMTLHLATSPVSAGLYNVGGGAAHTWLELVGGIFAAMEREPAIEFIPMPEAIRDKYQYHTEATVRKLRLAGYEAPVTPLAEAVRDYVQRYLVPDRRLGDERAG